MQHEPVRGTTSSIGLQNVRKITTADGEAEKFNQTTACYIVPAVLTNLYCLSQLITRYTYLHIYISLKKEGTTFEISWERDLPSLMSESIISLNPYPSILVLCDW